MGVEKVIKEADPVSDMDEDLLDNIFSPVNPVEEPVTESSEEVASNAASSQNDYDFNIALLDQIKHDLISIALQAEEPMEGDEQAKEELRKKLNDKFNEGVKSFLELVDNPKKQ